MKIIIRNLLQVWYSELYQVFHDGGLIIFCLLVPLFYPLLYSFIYDSETAREVPVALVDECHSKQSRTFARKVDATAEVTIAYNTDMAEAQELMRQEKVYAIIRIPASFDRDLFAGRQTYIGYYSDMRCMLYYKAGLMAASFVSLDMNRDIKVNNYIKGTTDRQEDIIKTPVKNDYVAMYNPQSGFASFLIPAVLMLMIQQLLCLTLGMSMGSFREKNNGSVVPLNLRGFKSPIAIVTGKALFYFPLFMLIAIYMYGFITPTFHLLQLASYSTFLAFMVPYLLSCIFMAITWSGCIYRREDTMLLFVIMSPILLFLSGMSWPVASEPTFWKYVSYIFPSTFGMHGYVRLMGTGCTLHEVAWEFRSLWYLTGFYFATACLLYRFELLKMITRVISMKRHLQNRKRSVKRHLQATGIIS